MLVAGDASRCFDDVAADVDGDGDVSIIAAVDECNACMRAAWARQAWRLPSTTSYSGAASPSLFPSPFSLFVGLATCLATKQLCKFVGQRFALFHHQKLPKNTARAKERKAAK